MAAAARRRRRTWRRKRKKQKVRWTKPLQKRRTSRAPDGQRQAAPKGLCLRLKRGSLNWYVSRLMSQVPLPTTGMSVRAKRLMTTTMGDLCKEVVTKADRRRRQRRGSFIGTLELQAAVDEVMKYHRGVHFAFSVPSEGRYLMDE